MRVREVMSSPVVTVSTTTTADDAARLLCARGFTALPVVDDGALVGLVSEADLVGTGVIDGSPQPGGRHEYPSAEMLVRDVMSTPVESLTPGADVDDAADIMIDERIRCLPVVDGYRVVGIITRRDLLRAALQRDDEGLADQITRQLAGLDTPKRWRVFVQDGVADIEDYGSDVSMRDRAARLAAEVPGVVSVHAHHQTPDPF